MKHITVHQIKQKLETYDRKQRRLQDIRGTRYQALADDEVRREWHTLTSEVSMMARASVQLRREFTRRVLLGRVRWTDMLCLP
jgi:predicted mannosyl-3-phosphoglycerate phosphatase (HAD superfamily)